MSPSDRPRLSELPGFIACKPGERLTEEQHRQVFSGGDRFWQQIDELASVIADDIAIERVEKVAI